MMRNAKLVILSMVLGTVALMAQASVVPPDFSPAVDPGLWETIAQMKAPGMPKTMPPQKTRHCVTQAELDKYQGIPQTSDKTMTCKVVAFKATGNVVAYTVKCTSSNSEMEMKGNWTNDSRVAYHGSTIMTGNFQGHRLQATSTFTAKRVGACSASGIQ